MRRRSSSLGAISHTFRYTLQLEYRIPADRPSRASKARADAALRDLTTTFASCSCIDDWRIKASYSLAPRGGNPANRS